MLFGWMAGLGETIRGSGTGFEWSVSRALLLPETTEPLQKQTRSPWLDLQTSLLTHWVLVIGEGGKVNAPLARALFS